MSVILIASCKKLFIPGSISKNKDKVKGAGALWYLISISIGEALECPPHAYLYILETGFNNSTGVYRCIHVAQSKRPPSSLWASSVILSVKDSLLPEPPQGILRAEKGGDCMTYELV